MVRNFNLQHNLDIQRIRKTKDFEAVFYDLVLMGALDRDIVEKYFGKKLSDFIKSPDGDKLGERKDSSRSV